MSNELKHDLVDNELHALIAWKVLHVEYVLNVANDTGVGHVFETTTGQWRDTKSGEERPAVTYEEVIRPPMDLAPYSADLIVSYCPNLDAEFDRIDLVLRTMRFPEPAPHLRRVGAGAGKILNGALRLLILGRHLIAHSTTTSRILIETIALPVGEKWVESPAAMK